VESLEVLQHAPQVFPAPASTMRSARIVAPRHVELTALPVPRPDTGQVRVRLQGCGVCGSNMAGWQGRPWFEYPLAPGAPGHEGWGCIDALGPGVDTWEIGDRVAFLSDRSFAEYAIADATRLVAAPEQETIFPGEALGCAVNVFHRSLIDRRQTVAVVGSGFIGALIIQLAAHSGARVVALSRRPFARTIARESGASAAFAASQQGLQRVLDITASQGCDCVVEAAGTQDALDLASRLVKVRGRLVIAGYHQDGPRQVDMQLWNWRGIDVINAHERDPDACIRGMRNAADLLKRNVLKTKFLYTHNFTLDHLADALDAVAERPDGFLKGWVAF
jgi:NADPH:quinone reductase